MREYRICSDAALLTVAWGRHLFPPWGAAGGRPGSPNYVEVLRDGEPVKPSGPAGGVGSRFGKVSRMPLRRGDVVRLVTGSGGGYGDPREREPGLIARDLRDGLITAADAAGVYGREPAGEHSAGTTEPESH